MNTDLSVTETVELLTHYANDCGYSHWINGTNEYGNHIFNMTIDDGYWVEVYETYTEYVVTLKCYEGRVVSIRVITLDDVFAWISQQAHDLGVNIMPHTELTQTDINKIVRFTEGWNLDYTITARSAIIDIDDEYQLIIYVGRSEWPYQMVITQDLEPIHTLNAYKIENGLLWATIRFMEVANNENYTID